MLPWGCNSWMTETMIGHSRDYTLPLRAGWKMMGLENGECWIFHEACECSLGSYNAGKQGQAVTRWYGSAGCLHPWSVAGR